MTAVSSARGRALSAAVVLLAGAVGLTGCGYRLMGTQLRPLEGVHSIEIGTFENRSREFGLDKTIMFAFEREFHRRGLLRVVEHAGDSDAVLSGTIREFTARPVAFDAQDEALQYEAEIVLDLNLLRRSDNRVLWRVSGLQRFSDYSVAAAITVPSTSSFQRGTMAVADLTRLTDIQLAQTEKRLMIDRLVEAIVRDVHDQIFDDF